MTTTKPTFAAITVTFKITAEDVADYADAMGVSLDDARTALVGSLREHVVQQLAADVALSDFAQFSVSEAV